MAICFEKLIDNKITINNTLYYLTDLDKPINKYVGKYLYSKTTNQLCTIDYSYNKINKFEFDYNDEDYYIYIYMYERSITKEIIWTSKLMLLDNYNNVTVLNSLLNNYQDIITNEQYNILSEIKIVKSKLDELNNEYSKLATNIIL